MNRSIAALPRLLVASFVALAALLPAPAGAANMNKVIHHVFPVAETGFDPQAVHDLYSGTVVQAIFETLLTYDYLARPSKLVPMAAEALPQVTDGGKTYTFKIKKGIYFTDDAAFKGQKRELVAEDFAYSLKRLMDPRCALAVRVLVEGKLTRPPSRQRRRAASSITTRRSRDSRRSTAIHCASA
jgi:ABC-type transport system substrate-binding protein